MPDQNKITLLRLISADVTPGNPTRLSFNTLAKQSDLSKSEMETVLTQLNKERFISQYAKKGVDSFTFMLTDKGVDAIQDESFI